jgi:uncharacterized protein (TIGR02757 family)
MLNNVQLKELLDNALSAYNHFDFIENDPICIPHRYKTKQDIEIMGFFAAILAWGQRKTIISNCLKLDHYFDSQPFLFIQESSFQSIEKIPHFVHRTFNTEDLFGILKLLKEIYSKYHSLEEIFFPSHLENHTIEQGLIRFRKYVQESDLTKPRTLKHIATPEKNSACKRLNMYLRWMVRKDENGVDFGIWKNIQAKDLICPLDVHVLNISKKLNILDPNAKADWKTSLELTAKLRIFDPHDPVKYDYALFGLGVNKGM